jgi:enoyl-CoA hydratase
MEYLEIQYDIQGAVRIIKFNRPQIRNCIGPTTHLELIDASRGFGTMIRRWWP